MTEIIRPHFERYGSLEAFNTGKPNKHGFDFGNALLNVSDLLDSDFLFVVAEPGHGKTTLIEQLKKLLSETKRKFQYTNGKSELPKSIAKNIEYLIFDALDECRDIIPTFMNLLTICKEAKLKLIISNRTHYLAPIRHLLQGLKFEVIRLMPFEDYQINTFLTNRFESLGYSQDDIEKIIQNSKSNSRKSVLATPRYLDEFSKYVLVNQFQADQVTRLSKSELFEKVIYYKLDAESESESNRKYLTKRVLERLALVMEIQGLNQISKEDFITFLDQTESNISLIFLNTIDLDDLLQRVMKTTGELLEFEHSEFQEYLAARELCRMGYRFQTVHDLMINQQLQLILPNWVDVLNFAIDIEPEFAKPIISFIESRRNENVDEKIVDILLNVDASKFEESYRDDFFKVVYGFYSSKNKVIYNANRQLARYITNSNKEIRCPHFSKNQLTDPVRHIQINQILLIEALAIDDRLTADDRLTWGMYLFELAKVDSLFSMHSAIFYALLALNDKQHLLALISEFESKEDHLLNGLLHALTELVANDALCVGLITRSMASDRRLDRLCTLINAVTNEDGITSIFETLTHTKSMFTGRHFGFDPGFHSLFESVKKINSAKLDRIIEIYVTTIFQSENHIYQIPDIVRLSLIYTLDKRPAFLKKLLTFPMFFDEISEVASKLSPYINLGVFLKLESFVVKSKSEWRLNEMIQKVANELDKNKSHDIYKYVDQKYLTQWRSSGTVRKKKLVEKTPIQKLREFYVKDKRLYNYSLVPYLVDNFDQLQNLLTEKDKGYLLGVVSIVLETYDPEKFEIKIDETIGDTTTYSHNQDTWFIIEFYFKAAFLLNSIDLLVKYREKLLKTIPRLEIHQHGNLTLVDKIIESIGALNATDIKLIYDFCISRKDDLLTFSARSFANVLKHLKLTQLNPVLLMLINSSKIRSFDKEEALSAFGELSNNDFDRKALQAIFVKEKKPSKIKEIANAYLVAKFNDEKAIKWRFGELKKRKQEFDTDIRYNGMRAVSSFESEMDRPEFPNCLYDIWHPLIYAQMLDLLSFSFEIRNRNLLFRYSAYLQSIVYRYFQSFLSPKIISDLRMVSNKYSIREQTYSFNFLLDKLVEELHQQQKKIEPFVTAVHSANEILSRTYLKIQSNEELKNLVLGVLDNEIKNLIENEGFYRVSNQLKGALRKKTTHIDEDLIQKTLKIALNKALLENGLRKTDIHREVESFDGLKYDYLISYGLYGPIVVELKLMHNREIINVRERNRYKLKLEKYLRANNGLGIYAVFQIHDKQSDREKYNDMCSEYGDMQGLNMIALNCF